MTRAERLAALASRRFDLLVVGGGITGAGAARDAAMRGLDVALVEKDDFASGTSSRSSRLVHGGLRYLEHRQLHLVSESVRERAILLRIAPHLVHPLEFTWPVYRGARVGRFRLAVGLTLYDLLARRRGKERRQLLDSSAVARREPALARETLAGGASYFDAATSDSRLTLANVLSAERHGAVVVNHCIADSMLVEAGRASGAALVCQLGGERLEVRARVVLSATGPWRNAIAPVPEAPVRHSRGTRGAHIAVPAERIGNSGAVTLIAPQDGRVMFVLPAKSLTMIGTTDTWTDISPDEVRASEADVEYLLAAANSYFPEARLTGSDVVSAWAGIRPLAQVDGSRSPAALSREHSIARQPDGHISVAGGKLTTYRAMAAEICDTVQHSLGAECTPAATHEEELPGSDRASRLAGLVELRPELGRPISPETAHTLGEMVLGVEQELAQTVGDLLIRRTNVAFETRDHGLSAAALIAGLVAPLLNWNSERAQLEVDRYAGEIRRMFSIDR